LTPIFIILDEESAADYERKRKERELKQLTRRAHKLGYTLSPAQAATPHFPPQSGSDGSF